MNNKTKLCTYEFRFRMELTLEGTPINVSIREQCPFARTMVDPTKCDYARKCKFQK